MITSTSTITSNTSPFEELSDLKPPALPEDTYFAKNAFWAILAASAVPQFAVFTIGETMRSLLGVVAALPLLIATLIFSAAAQAIPAPTIIKDINPRPYAQIRGGARVGSNLFFFYDHQSYGVELFKMDLGSGEVTLVKDLYPGPDFPPTGEEIDRVDPELAAVNGKIVFTGSDGAHGVELWVTDGTAAGTALLADIKPGASSSFQADLVTVGSKIYFIASSQAGGRELWYTDGTPAGTGSFDIRAGAEDSDPEGLTAYGTLLFFSANDGVHGREPYYINSTINTPTLISDLNPGAGSSNPGRIYFTWPVIVFAADDGVHGTELFISNGTPAGTTLLKDIGPGALGSNPLDAILGASRLFFTAQDPITSIKSVWKSDGTAAGTVKVADLPDGFGFITDHPSIAFLNGNYLFRYSSTTAGSEWYASDGTAGGTGIFKDIAPGANGGFGAFFGLIGGSPPRVIFGGRTTAEGEEPWASDGTSANTVMLADLAPGAASSNPQLVYLDTTVVYFAAYTVSAGQEVFGIFKTDGTASGTTLIGVLPTGDRTDFIYYGWVPSFPKIGERLYISLSEDEHGTELWTTDGTAAGTALVTDLNPGSWGSSAQNLAAFGDKLFFSANPGDGPRPYISDGTAAGTQMLADLTGGRWGAPPQPLGVVGGWLLFDADGATGRELYRTDGTPAGTSLVADLRPGANSGVSTYRGAAMGGQVYFAGDNGASGIELFKSDGSAAGTVLVSDIAPAGSSVPRDFAAASSRLFFTASTAAYGRELWISDGTAAGTNLVKDINPNAADSNISDLTVSGDRAFFAADDGVSGHELWVSDGTAAGTSLLNDISAGTDDTVIIRITAFRGGVLFIAIPAGSKGVQAWYSDGTPGGTVLLKHVSGDLEFPNFSNFAVRGTLAYLVAQVAKSQEQIWMTDGTPAGTTQIGALESGSVTIAPGTQNIEILDGELILLSEYGSAGREIEGLRIAPSSKRKLAAPKAKYNAHKRSLRVKMQEFPGARYTVQVRSAAGVKKYVTTASTLRKKFLAGAGRYTISYKVSIGGIASAKSKTRSLRIG